MVYSAGSNWRGKNSGGTALFDGGTFNENRMVLLRTVFVLKDILFKIQF